MPAARSARGRLMVVSAVAELPGVLKAVNVKPAVMVLVCKPLALAMTTFVIVTAAPGLKLPRL